MIASHDQRSRRGEVPDVQSSGPVASLYPSPGTAVSIDIPDLLDRLCYRYPSFLVDRVVEHDPGRRLVAYKNVTVNEDFFQGHFPGAPVMPGVLMMESLAQAATLLLLHREGGAPPHAHVRLRGVDDAKFRRQVVPGDRVRLEVARIEGRPPIARVRGLALIDDQIVAEMVLQLAIVAEVASIHPSANVHQDAVIGAGTTIGPRAVIGAGVRIGRDNSVGASTVIDGEVEIGDGNDISPFVSIGLPPQDLKYDGTPTRVVIGDRNLIREFVTIHRGTPGGGGVTSIGSRNLLMAYTHVAHDCHVGNDIIFGNMATLGGHVQVDDFASISAGSGVHQFCRVGRHAFVGGYSVVTRDAMPYAKTVGNRACIFGLNTIGLLRRGFSPEVVSKLKRAYRYLLVSKLNTSRAVARIVEDPSLSCPEVDHLVEFIKTSRRGVLLRRRSARGQVNDD